MLTPYDFISIWVRSPLALCFPHVPRVPDENRRRRRSRARRRGRSNPSRPFHSGSDRCRLTAKYREKRDKFVNANGDDDAEILCSKKYRAVIAAARRSFSFVSDVVVVVSLLVELLPLATTSFFFPHMRLAPSCCCPTKTKATRAARVSFHRVDQNRRRTHHHHHHPRLPHRARRRIELRVAVAHETSFFSPNKRWMMGLCHQRSAPKRNHRFCRRPRPLYQRMCDRRRRFFGGGRRSDRRRRRPHR